MSLKGYHGYIKCDWFGEILKMQGETVKVNWLKEKKVPALLFEDLRLNTPFRNTSPDSKGAVYIKVSDATASFMYEVQTGRLWPPTKSPVEIVDLTININLEKPQIYT